jgi:hypothetical protein
MLSFLAVANLLKAAVKWANLWPHAVAMLTAYNVPFGPFGEGKRALQARVGVMDWMLVSDAESDPLFAQMYERILFDRGEISHKDEEGYKESIWSGLRDHPMWHTQGSVVNMNRPPAV